MDKDYRNCGSSIPGKKGFSAYCVRLKRAVDYEDVEIRICPCRRWTRRLLIDRIRKGRKS